MSQSIASPSPLASFRRTCLRLWEDRDSRSVIVGIAGMLLVHLLLFFLAPRLLHSDNSASVLRPHSSSKEFSIELAPDAFEKEPPKQNPTNFVETNPNAPENIPDKTNNFAERNQQVAQEKPTENGKSERPAMEGQKEIHSNQIVTGQLVKPMESIPSPPAAEQSEKTPETPPKLLQNPLSGFEKTVGEAENSFGTNIAKSTDNAQSIPEKVDGLKDVPLIQGATSSQPKIDPTHPRSRPMITQQIQTRPAIFEENKFGTSNTGVIGISAQFSNYGAYIHRMLEVIQIQWDRIIVESRIYPTSGTHVIVKFKMDDKGAISAIVNVEGTAGNQGETSCVSAITSRAPYGEWTDDMKAVLGPSQELTIAFYYQ